MTAPGNDWGRLAEAVDSGRLDCAEHALGWAAAGIPVFPVRIWTDPGETKAKKKPLLKEWQLLKASTDVEQVQQWFSNPNANGIGVLTGVLFDAIDASLALESWADTTPLGFEAIPVGPVIGTSRGLHLYVQPTHIRNKTAVLPGVDFRSDGGFVVVPPSYGGAYRWGRTPWADDAGADPFPEVCDQLRELLRGPSQSPARAIQPRVSIKERLLLRAASGGRSYGEVAFLEEVAKVASAAEGTRNGALYKAAYSLGQFVGSGVLDDLTVVLALQSAARKAGLGESEIKAAIASGISRGKIKPRKVPA